MAASMPACNVAAAALEREKDLVGNVCNCKCSFEMTKCTRLSDMGVRISAWNRVEVYAVCSCAWHGV